MRKIAKFLGYGCLSMMLSSSHFVVYQTTNSPQHFPGQNLEINFKKSESYLDFSNFSREMKRAMTGLLQPIKSHERNSENTAQFEQIIQYAIAQNLPVQSMSEIVQAIANYFVGTPYQANLLDQGSEETLVVSFTGFDCVLFVETVLAIARGVALQDYSYHTFTAHLLDQRYRNANLNGYCSRLHYFSEWIFENQNRGTVANITPELGGIQLDKTLNFMSKNWQSYPRLVSSEADYQCIVDMEANLEPLNLYYLPKNQIQSAYQGLRAGDIIAVATEIDGLDVTHTGLVYRHENGHLGFIHASPSGRVTIAQDLATYISQVESAVGIIVARPVDPRSH